MKPSSFLISGAGDLGLRIAKRLRDLGHSEIVCETLGRGKHQALREEGFATRTRDDARSDTRRFDNVVVCYPPSPRYAEELKESLSAWNRKGVALLVSSIGVMNESHGAWIDETSPVDQTSAIYKAECVALEANAHVIRLAGLYDNTRGPHIFWHSRSTIDAWPETFINLIHRDDAADACVRILESNNKTAQLWCLSDGTPLSRQTIAEAWAKHLGPDSKAPMFAASEGSLGKRVSAEKFCKEFSWAPRWKNFQTFSENL